MTPPVTSHVVSPRTMLAVMQDDTLSIPAASTRLDDVSDLLGDPVMAKHVLRNYNKYAKGLVAEVSEFLFCSNFAIAKRPILDNNSKTKKGFSFSFFAVEFSL